MSVVPISLAVWAAASGSISATATAAPFSLKMAAMARPIPEPPPVTNATLPVSGLGGGRRLSFISSSIQYSIRNFSRSGTGA